ncbi:hypothetical protein [Clostridioides difficile]|uniref:hypothetical protein n=1 Tax=Clostridioides difficile TaxID=1496 RepID=UPI00073E2A8E|nr:hypothetical protein [Clostridioides difficile]MDL0329893.1 hypothetical protein [Clostridioides difficile]MDO0042949.1 hypothetical protein [Clostridioides difficile]MDX5682374.1 hypothetical protein [Clostridioides difficile]MDX5703942.1 hypothetical protein [Clostridioides difficile]MDX5725719.1 hypothetical protein [Clostridioides difficile]
MLSAVMSIIVTLLLFFVQKYLSSRKNWLLGIIIPVITLCVMAVIFFTMKWSLSLKTVLPFAIIFALELVIWKFERLSFYKTEERRMRANDL